VSGAVTIPGIVTTSQDAFHGTPVKVLDDLRGHAKSLQSPEGEEVLSCLLHDCAGVRGQCYVLSDVDCEELETFDPWRQ
jgi:hypothetical protein